MWRRVTCTGQSLGESLKGTPDIGIECRMINGIPVLFTTDGKIIRGQKSITVTAPWEDIVSVQAEILVEHDSER